MSSFQVVDSSPGSSVSIMETSNFAHVIFQNVGKSFLPQAPLECSYTLTPYLTPHPKDWVGIFKVGWSTARDYYTFLWSPMPENYEAGSTVHRTVVFQGYYVPKSDGEFYQFCYVTHSGDIRGASTPFQFRAATPTEELLTVTEDDSNSDILVVTTKTGLLERVEEAQQERRELLKTMRLLQDDKQQLQEEHRRLAQERDHERDTCALLRTHNQELLRSSQGLSEEREEVRRRLSEATERVRQLEEELLGVTQRGQHKDTELHCLRDRLKKLTAEKDGLESQLKNEKDERDLFKAHLRSTELENTKLSAELQMLKAVELNREVTIAQFQEELERLRLCVAQRDSLEKDLMQHKADQAELSRVREQLRQAEEQLQASRQQASLLASELRDSASSRDSSMSELYRARLETDKLRASLTEAQAECQRMESQLERMRSTAHTQLAAGPGAEAPPSIQVVSEAEVELQREVEELRLRLHMAAEHYKEKYRECQRLRRQVAKLSSSEQQLQPHHGEPKRNVSTETTSGPLTSSPDSPTAGNIENAILQESLTINKPAVSDGACALPDPLVSSETEAGLKEDQAESTQDLGQDRDVRAGDEQTERLQSLPLGSWVQVDTQEDTQEQGERRGEGQEAAETEEEEERPTVEEEEEEETASPTVEEELALMEQKWKEQCAINQTLKQRLANEEERFRMQMAERSCEVTDLKRSLALALRDKQQLLEELQRCVTKQRGQEAGPQGSEVRHTMVLRYPLPYPQEPSPPPLVSQQRPELRFGNPYSGDAKECVDAAVSPDPLPLPPPPDTLSCPQPCAPPLSPSSPSSNPASNLAPGPGAAGPGAAGPGAAGPGAAGPGAAGPGAAGPGAAGPGGWPQEVVCIQPCRSTSPPDSTERPPEHTNEAPSKNRAEARTSFCFDSSRDEHRRCPLCEVIFPPHFEQRSFELHVESHWKVCPVCSEQFPLHCQQQLFERHVLTHFDGHELNFHHIE